jgi:hypothetical protein
VSSADFNGLRGPSVERSRVMRGALAHHHLKVWLSIRLLILPIRLVDRLFGLVAEPVEHAFGQWRIPVFCLRQLDRHEARPGLAVLADRDLFARRRLVEQA